MNGGPSSAVGPGSTQPYLLRALHEWCCDNGFTPHIAVRVDASVQVPPEFVRGGEIVLNIGLEATSGLHLGNDCVRFTARFGGRAREVIVPVQQVMAIYARETGQGMAFAPPAVQAGKSDGAAAAPAAVSGQPEQQPGGDDPPPARPPAGGRPALRRVK